MAGLLGFDVGDIDGSIEHLLSGMKTAFTTSLVGMGLSIFYKMLISVGWLTSPAGDDAGRRAGKGERSVAPAARRRLLWRYGRSARKLRSVGAAPERRAWAQQQRLGGDGFTAAGPGVRPAGWHAAPVARQRIFTAPEEQDDSFTCRQRNH